MPSNFAARMRDRERSLQFNRESSTIRIRTGIVVSAKHRRVSSRLILNWVDERRSRPSISPLLSA
jgi:hypothetical protein